MSIRQSPTLWWLNPACIAGFMGLAVSLAAYAISDPLYQTNWRTPKYFGGEPLLLTLGFTLLFVIGALFANSGSQREDEDRGPWQEAIPWLWVTRIFWFCVIGSVTGYVVWAGVAVARGASLSLALGVLRGEKGASYEMKEVYLGTISGVTTLTQLGIAAMVLGVLIAAVQGWKAVRVPLALVFFLAVLRALFNSERLATIELAVPFIVLAIRLMVLDSPRYSGLWTKALQFAPMAGSMVLFMVFAAFEYNRSWSTFYSSGNMTFWEFISLRLLGYYVTALNNGALMIQRIAPGGVPFYTGHFLWRFPVVSNVVHAIYPNLALDAASPQADPYMQILAREANVEFNNPSALLPPVADFGVTGAMLYWLLAGMLCGLLYRWFRQGELAGLLLYPVFFTGIIETTRIPYWGEGRVVIAYFILVPLAWMVAGARRPREART